MIDQIAAATQVAIERGALQKGQELFPFLCLVSLLEPKVIVEIGSDSGGTLHAFRQVAPQALLISIDLPGAEFSTGNTLDAPDTALLITADSHVESTRQQLVDILAGRTIDVLFIDGDHTYDGVRVDYEMYSPLVKGIVVFHDIVKHEDPLVGVRQFWIELLGDKLLFIATPDHWGGIGLLYRDG